MSEQKFKVIIADDHRLFRDGINGLLKGSSLVEVIGEAENGNELIASYFNLKPDLILVDIAMPGLSGYEAFEKIKAQDPDVKACFLSMHTEEIYYYQIYKSGGKGLLSKNVCMGELEKAADLIMNGGVYFGADYPEERLNALVSQYEVLEQAYDKTKIHFTEREDEILQLIVKGYTSSEIAATLNLSKRTVDKHREVIMKKAKVKNLLELYQFAQEYY